ncbi:hypothetical protein Pan216_16430 [Planctomycetes bacterium Pan216]|uniref:Conserved hypothetical protein CHP03032 domain-containing protein n=1 Tax=Kolteria novifilia TaxID=2527975 RepID=A0A518B1D8_9BACT|nr:hypothetical protein Pan216_16430 [Planctomycetes bacterium Pan216]
MGQGFGLGNALGDGLGDGSLESPKQEPLRSVHTTSFPKLLNEIGASVLVSTYQAGKLIICRSEGETLNTHFRNFNRPMGLAANKQRLIIGAATQVHEFRNFPEVGKSVDETGRTDACYMPRTSCVTGDIDIHEMALGTEGLWLVNTRFSCLCVLDGWNSFVPRWRPPFLSGLSNEDRCHLNGLALVDGKPKYVTALGETDTRGGWRANKKSGGILMEVPSGEILLRGLSMPHSPRWYNGKLWVLESGEGRLSIVKPDFSGTETVAEVPGFTRGLDFVGPFAFVGLSQVRETAVFSGIPITERLTERICGVWVIDTRNGKEVAFVRFEDAVQEIFAVQVLVGTRFPDVINDDWKLIGRSYMLPNEALKDVAPPTPPEEGADPEKEDKSVKPDALLPESPSE